MGTKLFDSSVDRDPREDMEFLANILESSTEHAIIGTDMEGSLLLWNEGARRIYGYEPEEFIGKNNVEILYTPEDIALSKPRHVLNTVLRRGKWESTINHVRKNGQVFFARVVVTPRYDANRKVNGFLFISKDISGEIHVNEELKAFQFYTRSLVESNIDALMTTDPLGIITDVNLQMCEMTAFSRKELIGTAFKLYFTDSQRAEDGIRKVLTEDRVTNYELTMRSREGQETAVSYNATTFRDAQGKLQGVFAAARDITKQQQIEEKLRDQQNYTRSLIESNIDALMTTDPLGVITDVNRQMCEITGRSRAELNGTPFKDYFTDPKRAEDGIRKALTEGRVTNYELTIKASNGRETIVSYNAITFQGMDGRLRGVFAAARDIVEQKALEEQLQRKNEELEVQNSLVQEANRLKSEFLANMSHELRTPLNGIIGFTEMMYDGETGQLSDEQHDYLGDVLASSRHLLQLINDVLDLAKVESGKMTFSPEEIDLERVVGDVRDNLRILINRKHIHFEIEIGMVPNEVVIDLAKFKQVLYNYLSNALKFSPDEGKVTVRIKPEGDDSFLLEVEDSGQGIASEDLAQLFVEFQQLDAGVAKKHQGTGLGLALTKHIVEAQGGKVDVRSTPGVGSTFFALLPRVNTMIEEFVEHERTIELAYPALPPLKGSPIVLVINDDPRDQNKPEQMEDLLA